MFLDFNSMHIQWKSNQPDKEKQLRCYYSPEHGETLVLWCWWIKSEAESKNRRISLLGRRVRADTEGTNQHSDKHSRDRGNTQTWEQEPTVGRTLPHPLDHHKSKRVAENHPLLLYWLCQSLWLCGSQQTLENSERDGNTRPPDLPLEKSVCRSRSNS